MTELVWADADLHNSQPCGLTSVHWNQSWNEYVITKSGTPNIKVSWTLTLLYSYILNAHVRLCFSFVTGL